MEKVGAYTDRVTASGEWQGGDVQSGLRATPMTADYFNMLQRELVGVVEGSGIALDKNDDHQLLQAIRRIRGGAAANFGPWIWSTSLAGNPGQGHMALNNANPALATELRISEASAEDEDFTQSLSLLRAGDTITFQDQDAVLSYRFRVTNSSIDNGTYRSVPVRHLSGAGGLPADNTVVSVLLTLAGASDDGVPVGSILPFPKAAVPAGYLELDGSVQSSTTYPDLFAYLGTAYNTGGEPAGYFRLPDSRGEFLRGWDHGRGVDAGRTLGSGQLDALQNITGKLTFRGFGPTSSGSLYTADGPFSLTVANGGSSPYRANLVAEVTPQDVVTFDVSKVARTATETRPRNLAVMWCIKAWNAPVNQANIDIGALAVQVSGLEQRQRALGDGQTTQDLTANRLIGTVYPNTTGRTIWVIVSVTLAQGSSSTFSSGAAGDLKQRTFISNNGTGGSTLTHSVPVLPGEFYSVSGGSLNRWNEVRV